MLRSTLGGTMRVQVTDHVVRCQVTGSMEPLLKAVAGAGVHELLSREPSLEELFLVHYGDDMRSPATQAGSAAPPLALRRSHEGDAHP